MDDIAGPRKEDLKKAEWKLGSRERILAAVVTWSYLEIKETIFGI